MAPQILITAYLTTAIRAESSKPLVANPLPCVIWELYMLARLKSFSRKLLEVEVPGTLITPIFFYFKKSGKGWAISLKNTGKDREAEKHVGSLIQGPGLNLFPAA